MIIVRTDQDDFTYDIHSLVKAFYPAEDVIVLPPGKEAPVRQRQTESAAEVSRTMDVVIPQGLPDRKQTKDALKQGLYQRLVAETGRELPWGSLTGIRPVRIPMMMLAEGRTHAEISDHMRQTYFCSEKKARLAIEIAERERSILQEADYTAGYSLYVGIPFCPTTCLYCSFASYPVKKCHDQIAPYLSALFRELTETAALFAGRKLYTVYLGGGTPTALEPVELEQVISKIKSTFDLSSCREFTVEAGRPDSITEEKLAVLRAYGVDRISVNPQTFSQKTLDLIGRNHTVAQTEEAYALARRMGFSNINMDLILGLPGENTEDVSHTMERIRALSPDDVTVHSLAIKRASRLKIEMDSYRQYQMENTSEQMEIAESVCREIGRTPYYLYRQKNMAGNFENVGYAAPGKAGIYNILMMEEVGDIAACGAGTVSKRVFPDGREEGTLTSSSEVAQSRDGLPRAKLEGRIERCDTVKDLDQYISRIGEMIERKRELFGTEKNL